MIDWSQLIPIILQTIVIVVAIAAAFMRTRERLAIAETRLDHIEALATDTAQKVDGISRHVAALEAKE